MNRMFNAIDPLQLVSPQTITYMSMKEYVMYAFVPCATIYMIVKMY